MTEHEHEEATPKPSKSETSKSDLLEHATGLSEQADAWFVSVGRGIGGLLRKTQGSGAVFTESAKAAAKTTREVTGRIVGRLRHTYDDSQHRELATTLLQQLRALLASDVGDEAILSDKTFWELIHGMTQVRRKIVKRRVVASPAIDVTPVGSDVSAPPAVEATPAVSEVAPGVAEVPSAISDAAPPVVEATPAVSDAAAPSRHGHGSRHQGSRLVHTAAGPVEHPKHPRKSDEE